MNRRLSAAWVAWLVLGAGWVAALQLPRLAGLAWAWGVAPWTLWPAGYGIGASLLGAGALGLALRASGRAPAAEVAKDRRHATPARSRPAAPNAEPSAWLHLAWILPLAALVFWLLRTRTYFLGDGYTRLFVTGELRGTYKAPLDRLFNRDGGLLLGRLLGDGLERGQVWISILSGVGCLAVLPGLLRAAGVPARSRWLAFAVLAVSGWAQLFCGYLESYPLYLFGLLLFVRVGLGCAGRGAKSLWVLPAWGLLQALHYQGFLMLPAALVAAAGVFGGGGAPPKAVMPGHVPSDAARRSPAPRWALPVVAAAVLGIGYLLLGRIVATRASGGVAGLLFKSLLESLRRTFATGGSAAHFFTDRLNELALVWAGVLPLAAFALGAPARPAGGSADRDADGAVARARGRFLAMAALGGLGALVYSGTLGAARDWDLLAPSLVPAEIWLVTRASRRLGSRERVPVLATTVLLSLLNTGPWLASQAEAVRGTEWAYRLGLEGPGIMKFTSHDRAAMSRLFTERGEWNRAAIVLEGGGAAERETARLRVPAGRARLVLRQDAAAAADFEAAWRGGLRSAGLEGLAVALIADPGVHLRDSRLERAARTLAAVDSAGSQDRLGDAWALAEAGLRLLPGEPIFLRREAMVLMSGGREAAALPLARRALSADTLDAGAWSDVALLCERLGLAAQASAARAGARRAGQSDAEAAALPAAMAPPPAPAMPGAASPSPPASPP